MRHHRLRNRQHRYAYRSLPCRTCQKAHAAPFATTAGVLRTHFRWLQGEEKLSPFESSPGKLRYFCSVCGSHLVAERLSQPNVIVRVATPRCFNSFNSVCRNEWNVFLVSVISHLSLYLANHLETLAPYRRRLNCRKFGFK